MRVSDWLTSAEAAVRCAAGSVPASESAIDEAASFLRSHPSGPPLDSETIKRLKLLRQELVAIQTLARHGAALYLGLDQFDQASVIGYTPTGLERTL